MKSRTHLEMAITSTDHFTFKDFQLAFSPAHFRNERLAWRTIIQLNLIRYVLPLSATSHFRFSLIGIARYCCGGEDVARWSRHLQETTFIDAGKPTGREDRPLNARAPQLFIRSGWRYAPNLMVENACIRESSDSLRNPFRRLGDFDSARGKAASNAWGSAKGHRSRPTLYLSTTDHELLSLDLLKRCLKFSRKNGQTQQKDKLRCTHNYLKKHEESCQ